MAENAALRSQSDEELARLTKAGQRTAFEELVRRYQVPVLHFLLRKASNHHEAEDLVQETFVRAFRKIDLYSEMARFRPWLFTIAHRVLLNAHRRQRPQNCETAMQWQVSSRQGPAEQIAARDAEEYLWKVAAEQLKPRQFTALWLFYAETMPVKDIAAVLELSETAVKTLLFRARRKLLPHLKRLDPTWVDEERVSGTGSCRATALIEPGGAYGN